MDEHCNKRMTLSTQGLTVDALTFYNKKHAFAFDFPHFGANVGVYPLEYEGENYAKPYMLNLAYQEDMPSHIEVSFVCGRTRYLITSMCREGVMDRNVVKEDDNKTGHNNNKDVIEAVRRVEKIVMLMK